MKMLKLLNRRAVVEFSLHRNQLQRQNFVLLRMYILQTITLIPRILSFFNLSFFQRKLDLRASSSSECFLGADTFKQCCDFGQLLKDIFVYRF